MPLNDERQYKYEDFNLFIGLITLPPEEDFFNKEIKGNLFENYKRSILKYSIDQSIDNIFYSPKAYYIFGGYDLAIIALVDDISLESKIFHPNHGFGSYAPDFVHQFKYKVISGFIPKSERYPKSNSNKGIKELFSSEVDYDYIAICELKLNNGLLIGNGILICQIVQEYIDQIVDKEDSIQKSFIIESNGCDEITLFLWGSDLFLMKKALLTIKENQFSNLYSELGVEFKSQMDDIIDNCLISKLYKNDSPKEKAMDSHIFSNSNVFFGFRYVQNNNGVLKQSNVKIRQKISAKTGHLNNALSFHQNIIDSFIIVDQPKKNFKIQSGGSELIIKSNISSAIDNFKNLENKVYRNDVAKIVSELEFKDLYENKTLQKNNFPHPQITKKFREKFVISVPILKVFKNNLRNCKLSKISIERALKMIGNYNENVVDPVLCGYFIELSWFLDNFILIIHNYSKENQRINIKLLDNQNLKKQEDLIEYHFKVEKFIEQFEIGFKNRLFQSYLINNLTDINLEYNGGVQQLCSALDATYKTICRRYLGENQIDKFIYISGFNGADSTHYGLRVNYFHIFQPEFFAAIVHHEVFNQFIVCGGDRKLRNSESELIKSIISSFEYQIQDPTVKSFFDSIGIHFQRRAININISSQVFLRKLISDYLTLKIAYKDNIELYHFWWWHNAFQIPLRYNANGEFSSINFFSLLFRNILLYKQTNHQDFIDDIRFTPISPQCNTLWIKYFKIIEEVADLIIENDFLKKLTSDLLLYTNDCVAELDNDIVDSFIDSLTNGNAILYDQKRFSSEINFIDDLLYSYLIAFKKIIINGSGSTNFVLKRSTSSNNPDIKHILTSKSGITPEILFDPRGGTFIISHEKMKKTMNLRAAFTKSLWHFSMINKLKYFENGND